MAHTKQAVKAIYQKDKKRNSQGRPLTPGERLRVLNRLITQVKYEAQKAGLPTVFDNNR